MGGAFDGEPLIRLTISDVGLSLRVSRNVSDCGVDDQFGEGGIGGMVSFLVNDDPQSCVAIRANRQMRPLR